MPPPLRLEKDAYAKNPYREIERWPQREGYRAAERISDVALMPGSEVPEAEVKWLWPGVIAFGHVTLVAGESGAGKSFWMADLAGRASFARPWPGPPIENPQSKSQNAQGSVLMVNSDDSFVDVQRPRLAAAQAQLPAVGLMRRMPPGSTYARPFSVGPVDRRVEAVKTAVKEAGDCRLVIVDDLARFVRDGLGKVDRANLHLAIDGLKCVAAECDVAVVVVWRLDRMGRSSARILEALLPGAATGWLVAADPYGRDMRWLAPLKNQFGPAAPPMTFHIAEGAVYWDAPPECMPADVMAAFVRKNERRVEREQAGRWALERLADGPVEANVLFDDAVACGFSRRTVRRALDDLGLRPTKQGNDGPWQWQLPPATEESREASHCPSPVICVTEGPPEEEEMSATVGEGDGKEGTNGLGETMNATAWEGHPPGSPVARCGAPAEQGSGVGAGSENDRRSGAELTLVVLRPDAPGVEVAFEDGQLRESSACQTSGP